MGIAVGAVYLLRTELNLLFAKEPLIDEKEQMMIASCAPFEELQGFSPINDNRAVSDRQRQIMIHAKDRFVCMVMLSFLDDVVID
ncbi:hypothetical protein V7S43_010990 [Phytophthora oleae]|uniref:Uncharacterized protein n=1 Tax=Phytophthora oleae TaxID=2107226 RepID=A0ABD3FEH6_9STRA